MTLNRLVRGLINKPVPIDINELSNFPLFIEPKYDGERVLVFIIDGDIKVANRHNSVYRLPEDIGTKLPKQDTVLDAEFISKSGKFYDFLSARSNGDGLALAIFDVLLVGDKDIRDENYLVRRRYLKDLIEDSESVFVVESKIVWNLEQLRKGIIHYIGRGFEGVVIKPMAGYSATWFKVKRKETVDVAILGITKTKSWLENRVPYSFLIGTYNGKEFEPLGKVGSGLSIEEKVAIAERLNSLVIAEDENFVYVEPDIVLEVEYQEKTDSGFRSPRIRRIRYDKSPKECVCAGA